MNTSGENIDFELIARHLSGETTPEEEKQFQAWMEFSEENRKQFEECKSIWENMERVSSVASLDINVEWKFLESQMEKSASQLSSAGQKDAVINISSGQKDAVIDISSGQRGDAVEAGRPVGRSRSMLFVASRIAVAAFLVMALAIGGIFTSRNVGYRTLVTADLADEVILPDGSSVFLNTFSSIRYPKKFNKLRRDVSMDGEGFFEVNGDPEWPFVITTTEVDIRVLGTSFNVNAYKGNNNVEVVVKTGEVAVTRHGDVPKTIILKPGSKAVFDKTGEDLRLSTKIDKNFLAWKTKSFVFEDESLTEVAASLNKVYASDIIIPSDSLKQARITCSFNEQSLEAILKVLSATLDIEIVESGGEILLKESN